MLFYKDWEKEINFITTVTLFLRERNVFPFSYCLGKFQAFCVVFEM